MQARLFHPLLTSKSKPAATESETQTLKLHSTLASIAPIQTCALPSITFASNKEESGLKIAYQTYGDVKEGRVVVVLTGFGEKLSTPNPLIGPSNAIDPEKFFIVRIGLPGGGDSSSPSNNTSCPFFHPKDIVAMLQAFLILTFPSILEMPTEPKHAVEKKPGLPLKEYDQLEKLGRGKGLYSFIGSDLAGVVGWQWLAALWNDGKGSEQGGGGVMEVGTWILACTGSRVGGHIKALLEGPKSILLSSAKPETNLRSFGRTLCAWSKSPEWFERERWNDLGYNSMEEYIVKEWEDKYATWAPEDLLAQIYTWQHGDTLNATSRLDIAPKWGGMDVLLGAVKSRMMLMPSRTDQIFVNKQTMYEMRYLPNARLTPIESISGHSAGSSGFCGGGEDDEAFVRNKIGIYLEYFLDPSVRGK